MTAPIKRAPSQSDIECRLKAIKIAKAHFERADISGSQNAGLQDWVIHAIHEALANNHHEPVQHIDMFKAKSVQFDINDFRHISALTIKIKQSSVDRVNSYASVTGTRDQMWDMYSKLGTELVKHDRYEQNTEVFNEPLPTSTDRAINDRKQFMRSSFTVFAGIAAITAFLVVIKVMGS